MTGHYMTNILRTTVQSLVRFLKALVDKPAFFNRLLYINKEACFVLALS
jgi:hypothetical protein